MNAFRMSAVACLVIAVAATSTYGAWTWTTLDYPGATNTQANGISGNNIVGDYTQSGFHGFIYDGSTWTSFRYGNQETIALGVSEANIVGFYWDSLSASHGFRYNGATWTILDYPGAPYTQARGILGNNIVGLYQNLDGSNGHGFLYDGSHWTSLTYPGATWTSALGISGNNIVGAYRNSDGSNGHGFLYDGSHWTSLTYPGATWTSAVGISGNNIVGAYGDASGHGHGFLYDGMNWTTLDWPSGANTSALGIDGNNIVGQYFDAANNAHGFLLTIPEPTTSVLLIAGGLLAGIRRRWHRTGAEWGQGQSGVTH